MKSINKVFLSGNLCRDLEVKQITEKFTVGNTSMAVTKQIKKGDTWEESAEFYDLRFINSMATNLEKFLKKGTRVFIEGALNTDRWEKDGQKYSRVYVEVMQINFGGSGKRDGESAENNGGYEPVQGDGFPEDIPF